MSPEEIEDLDLREEGRGTQGAIESRSVELDDDEAADEDADEDDDADASADDAAPENDEDE